MTYFRYVTFPLCDHDFSASLEDTFEWMIDNNWEDFKKGKVTQKDFIRVLVGFSLINSRFRTVDDLEELQTYFNYTTLTYTNELPLEDHDNSSFVCDLQSKYFWRY